MQYSFSWPYMLQVLLQSWNIGIQYFGNNGNSYYICKPKRNKHFHKYKWIWIWFNILVIFSDLGSLALLIYRHEGDEWGLAEDGRISVAPHLGCYDNQLIYGNACRYLYYLCCSELSCNYRYDGFFCKCRFADLSPSNFRYYGCQHWYYVYGMDYVAGVIM